MHYFFNIFFKKYPLPLAQKGIIFLTLSSQLEKYGLANLRNEMYN